MNSGISFSGLFIVWIIGLIAGIYMMYPTVNQYMISVRKIEKYTSPYSANEVVTDVADDSIDYVSYTPLAIFDVFESLKP